MLYKIKKFFTQKVRIKRLFYTLTLLCMTYAAVIGFSSQMTDRTIQKLAPKVEAREVKEVEVVKELSLQEQVFEMVEEKLGAREAIKAVTLIDCESRWNPDVVAKEPNGTLSYGLFQINSIHKGISNADKLNWKKATEWSIEKRIRDGHWRAWTCGRSL